MIDRLIERNNGVLNAFDEDMREALQKAKRLNPKKVFFTRTSPKSRHNLLKS